MSTFYYLLLMTLFIKFTSPHPVFTTFDLKNGFSHLEVEETSRIHTFFVTHEEQCEFLKCSFGLTISPSVFQNYIWHVFRQLVKDRIVVLSMDDLIIPSDDELEGIHKLKLVRKTATEHSLDFNLTNC